MPQIYEELQRKSERRMDKVILRASFGGVFIFILIGVFGYATFSHQVDEILSPLKSANILEADYGGSSLI